MCEEHLINRDTLLLNLYMQELILTETLSFKPPKTDLNTF